MCRYVCVCVFVLYVNVDIGQAGYACKGVIHCLPFPSFSIYYLVTPQDNNNTEYVNTQIATCIHKHVEVYNHKGEYKQTIVFNKYLKT